MNLKRFVKGMVEINRGYIKEQLDRKRISRQKKYSYFDLYDRVHECSRPCFVLSTGRCGTQLLTKLLNLHKQIIAYHKPQPELIFYSKKAYLNYSSKHNELAWVIDAARYELIKDAFLLDKQYVETNNRITFFAYQLAEIYPDSKFIHLVREPIAFVRSGISRNWYSGRHPHDEGRICPSQTENINWDDYSNVQKIAWLWNETNTFIESFKRNLREERCLTVFSEELFQKPRVSNSILTFLGLDTIPNKKILSNLKKPINKQKFLEEVSAQDLELIKELTPLREKYYQNGGDE